MSASAETSLRFFSDDLMLEVGMALVEKKLVSARQIEELNSRRALTGKSLDVLIREERLVDDSAACAWLRGFGTILLGGAPAGAGLLARARAAQLPVAIAYGASETAAVFAAQRPAAFLRGERARSRRGGTSIQMTLRRK